MRDPLEGVAADGTIVTGARRDRVAAEFEPVLDAVVDAIVSREPDASVYLYGSVATGQARLGHSDVDILAIALPRESASAIARSLTDRFRAVTRGVEIGVAEATDFVGDHDQAYGNRVFLHHYCVRLAGPDHDRAIAPFPADRRAARGFNGDLARHVEQLTAELADGAPTLGRRIARKALLAVAGLVSVHDETWTTDRVTAARRWGVIRPDHAGALDTLVRWCDMAADPPGHREVAAMLDGAVASIVHDFEDSIGLWA